MENVTYHGVAMGGKIYSLRMANLSDKMLYFIHEDMKQWNGTEEEILTAQKKVLELGNFCLKHNNA